MADEVEKKPEQEAQTPPEGQAPPNGEAEATPVEIGDIPVSEDEAGDDWEPGTVEFEEPAEEPVEPEGEEEGEPDPEAGERKKKRSFNLLLVILVSLAAVAVILLVIVLLDMHKIMEKRKPPADSTTQAGEQQPPDDENKPDEGDQAGENQTDQNGGQTDNNQTGGSQTDDNQGNNQGSGQAPLPGGSQPPLPTHVPDQEPDDPLRNTTRTSAETVKYLMEQPPSRLGLAGDDMKEYEVFPSEQVVMVNGTIACSEITIYGLSPEGTNVIMGVFLVSRGPDGRIFKLDKGAGTITELVMNSG